MRVYAKTRHFNLETGRNRLELRSNLNTSAQPRLAIQHMDQLKFRKMCRLFLNVYQDNTGTPTVGAESLFRAKSLCRGTFAIDLRPLKLS